jgi:hypothetical protein
VGRVIGSPLRRLAVGAALVGVGAILAGCAAAVTPSRLGEYEARAELLTTEIVAAIPDDLGAEEKAQESKALFGEPLAFDKSRELAWWEDYTSLAFPDAASVDAALTAVDGYFAADEDDWAVEPGGDIGNGKEAVTYGLGDLDDESDDADEWIVEVMHGDDTIDIIVHSPLTVRGDELG